MILAVVTDVRITNKFATSVMEAVPSVVMATALAVAIKLFNLMSCETVPFIVDSYLGFKILKYKFSK